MGVGHSNGGEKLRQSAGYVTDVGTGRYVVG